MTPLVWHSLLHNYHPFIPIKADQLGHMYQHIMPVFDHFLPFFSLSTPLCSVGCEWFTSRLIVGFRQSHGIPKGCWSPSEHVCLLVFESVLDRSYWLTNINAVESYFDFSSSHLWSLLPLLRTPSYWIHLPAR